MVVNLGSTILLNSVLSKPITEKLSQPTRTVIKTSEDARQIIGGDLYL